jgi:RNA polymerase sigma factor (TIGR02999 family)
MSDVTRLLDAAQRGDRQAAADLLPLVYDELRKLAAARMTAEPTGHTLSATALVHEAYLRLVGAADAARWDGRGHFFAAAAAAMRRILVDRARRVQSDKCGGGFDRIDLDAERLLGPQRSEDLLALDEALDRLGLHDPRKAKLVELKFFAGLSLDEAAAALGVSPATADRDWAYARAWLHTEISKLT